MKHTVFLIEDDIHLAKVLEQILVKVYDLRVFYSAEDALLSIKSVKPDLLITDLSLPGIDGLAFVRKLRKMSYNSPIILITTFGSTGNEILSYRFGTNIFHKKPLNYELLQAQMSMLLSTKRPLDSKVFQLHGLKIDLASKIILDGDKKIPLTKQEAVVLGQLFEQKTVVSRYALVQKLQELKYDTGLYSVDVIITRLRTKLSDKNKAFRLIESVYGEGYRINPLFVQDLQL